MSPTVTARLYVAGPMTGLPEFNRPAFFAAEASLRVVGYGVLNPARREPVEGKAWEDYLRDGLTDLLVCTGVALLPGWMDSRGARLEVSTAWALSFPVRTVDAWIGGPPAEPTVTIPARLFAAARAEMLADKDRARGEYGMLAPPGSGTAQRAEARERQWRSLHPGYEEFLDWPLGGGS
jgi:hypothetical protein